MDDNFAYCIFDLSDVHDEIDLKRNTLDLRYTPGIKCIPNKTAMEVYASVLNEWKAIWDDRENDVWKNEVKRPYFGNNYTHREQYNLDYRYIFNLVVTNGNGEVIAKKSYEKAIHFSDFYMVGRPVLYELNVKSQKQYYSASGFDPIYISNIKLDDVIGDINIKIDSVYAEFVYPTLENGKWKSETVRKKPAGLFSVEEWNEFINK